MSENKTQEQKVDDLVSLLDNFVNTGGGHIDVKVGSKDDPDKVTVKTYKSQACMKGMACQVPTLHEGLDGKE